MKGTSPVLLVFLVLFFALQVMARRTGSELRKLQKDKQTEFREDERIKHPVKIPDVVLQMLKEDERVKQCLLNSAPQGNDIASWFAASTIHLNDDHQPDLVVKPENACLFGANIIPFWIFRKAGNDYKLAFKTHSLSVGILRTKTNGYRDISVGASTAAMFYGATYKFDGKKYLPKECWEQRTEKTRSKVIYFKCSGDPDWPYR